MKHTPGPRHVFAGDTFVKVKSETADICDLDADAFSAKDEDVLAHARLIAAAPSMLKALKAASRALSAHTSFREDGDDYNNEDVIEALDTVDATIRQAEGE